MGYGYGGGWMWVFGGLMMVGVLVVIGVLVWAVLATTRRDPGPTDAPPRGVDVRPRARQILDERYARGEIAADEYAERRHLLES